MLSVYADAKLDFADATIVAMAERLDVETILTLERRDFSIVRPNHIRITFLILTSYLERNFYYFVIRFGLICFLKYERWIIFTPYFDPSTGTNHQ